MSLLLQVKLLQLIIWAPLMSVPDITAIHPVVKMFQSGTKCRANEQTVIAIARAMLILHCQ